MLQNLLSAAIVIGALRVKAYPWQFSITAFVLCILRWRTSDTLDVPPSTITVLLDNSENNKSSL